MTDFISKGIGIIKDAVAADQRDEKAAALSMYKKGIEYLMTGMKYEKNKSTKAAIGNKIGEYLNRAEELQQELSGAEQPKKKAIVDGKAADDDDEDPEITKMQAALSSAIVSETPNVKWSDVAGLETAKGLLKEAVLLPIRFPQLFVGKRKPWRGILLYGPPGTGKSFLAKAVATEAGASTFFSVSSSDLVSKFLGESERLVRNLFELARAKSPAIIFIDEIDSLCGNRSDGENDSARRIKTEFLVQMQGVGKSNDGVLVLGATNTPWSLDPAIRRRFEKRIYIPLPDEIARKVMFQVHIGDTPHDLSDDDFAQLGAETDGFSGSDISVIVRDALMEPVRRLTGAKYFKKIKQNGRFEYVPCSPNDKGAQKMSIMDIPNDEVVSPQVKFEDFWSVVKTAKPSVSDEDVERHIEWTSEFGQEG